MTYGVGLNAASDKLEAGIMVDVNTGNKYVGHQGSLKFKVKF